ncbi:19638_t:CDS:2 [Funneliformis geosporum]|uniref:15485_t:CDS:1 n=1 Tax=Funneliformis geosporum TaxID=1117311 RepID=A0A9W4SN54_9GLOM|nr:19638_t:CDS:2 [Funneliformis geosporum]CAI2176285.1 15485_t:CDS:2 [Funneliformis geosporum]
MPPAVETSVSGSIKQHHGEIIYESNGFIKKMNRKDSQLNQRILNTYTGMWQEDKKDFSNKEETTQLRRDNAQKMTNAFYDIGDTFDQSIKRHELYLPLKLGMDDKHKTLDVGCGVGGPLREIVRLSGAHVTGINNNAYQIERCKAYSKKLGIENKTNFIKGDFTKIPRELDGKFDSAYAIEATLHAPTLELAYSEIFRALKPGGCFATYEWVTTPKYDENDPEHRRIIHGIEEGNSIPSLSSYKQALEAATNVGFEVLEYEDMATLKDYHVPWYLTLKGNFSLNGFRMTRIGRWATHKLVYLLECFRIVASGSADVAIILNNTADALVEGGELEIFTPMFFILLKKPSVSQ